MNPTRRLSLPLATGVPSIKGHAIAVRCMVSLTVCFLVCAPAASAAQTETIRADLKLTTGGKISGPVVDYSEEAIVIVHDETPYVFAWNEIETPTAIAVKKNLLALAREGFENLTAEDYFQLGKYALSRGRNGLAAGQFRQARQLDRAYGPRIREAFITFRRAREARGKLEDRALLEQDTGDSSGSEKKQTDLAKHIERELDTVSNSTPVGSVPPDLRDRILEVYMSFGAKVREVISSRIVLIETDHFLIWTDWGPHRRDRLASGCEAMYSALCKQFGFETQNNIFLAKCPVFCFRSPVHFRKFARVFDGYDSRNAVGYTRSIEANGHVHIVLLRTGNAEEDYDNFASTMVHEGTHAFIHRLFTTRLIPHWVNEGYADMIAERVLQGRCHNKEKAVLLARQYVHFDWPLGGLLREVGPIETHQYPLAHSIVAYLESRGSDRFAKVIRDLKAGQALEDAISTHYDNLTLPELESGWRAFVRKNDPLFPTAVGADPPRKPFEGW